MVGVTSAGGLLALLDEPDPKMQSFALQKLEGMVSMFWAEISDAVTKIEALYEDDTFMDRQLAALIASQVYYHLGEYELALEYALASGEKFSVFADSTAGSEYVDTVVRQGVDKYVDYRQKADSSSTHTDEEKAALSKEMGAGVVKDLPEMLEKVVNQIVENHMNKKKYAQAIGVAIESRRIDLLGKILEVAKEKGDLKKAQDYLLSVASDTIDNRDFRRRCLSLLVESYTSVANPDYLAMCHCLISIDDPGHLSTVIGDLIADNDSADKILMAYQMAADVYENASQSFVATVQSLLPERKKLPKEKKPKAEKKPTPAESEKKEGENKEGEEEQKVVEYTTGSATDDEFQVRVNKLHAILTGEVMISLQLEFLYRANNTDMLILKNTKSATPRNPICFTAVVLSHAFMQAGTANDAFLRDNLEWLGRATNWTKFIAASTLGVIHRGNIGQSMSLLEPYLPKGGVSSSPYSEGGGLMALGLIHANMGSGVTQYLMNQLQASNSEVVQHGACFGLGVASLGSGDRDHYDELVKCLYTDSAVAGEAAGIAMGLVMLGSCASDVLDTMLQYAHDTQHEKIIRGLAIGMSLICYGCEEEADEIIAKLLADKDAILRMAGVYSISMAYQGTGHNESIRNLLHVAVSDVNDDVRRAAVTGLGFILSKTPEAVPPLVTLLSESYNAHVRYGSALALGIACAGTGNRDAINLLEPLANDAVDYVRQGALIALAMVCIQCPETQFPKAKQVRSQIEKAISDKHEDVMVKFGAIMAQGILDAGGRNVTLTLHSRSGQSSMPGVIGLHLFTQFWFWYPIANFLSLAFTPTTLIAINHELKMPKLQLKCNTRPSLFAYPPKTQPPKEQKKDKVTRAVLSTFWRTQAAKDRKSGATGPEGDDKAKKDGEKKDGDKKDAMDTDEKKEGEASEEKPKKEPEPTSFELENPSRVLATQLKHVKWTDDRYVPLKALDSLGGVLILKKKDPDMQEELVELTAPKPDEANLPEEEDEPDPPQPFTYDSDAENA
eukprot:Clim_evm11s145 gene=Clim_evmTU11s145